MRCAALVTFAILTVALSGCSKSPTTATTGLTTTSGAPAPCTASPAQMEGPYFLDGRGQRSDIRGDEGAVPAGFDEFIDEVPGRSDVRPDVAADLSNAQDGAVLQLTIKVSTPVEGQCAPLRDARVDLWHANATGVYSGFGTAVGRDFLRGYQVTGADGKVTFTTIWPGWYPGRAVHMHVKVRTYDAGVEVSDFTSQLYFDDAQNDQVLAKPPYAGRGSHLSNAEDGIYGEGGASLLVDVDGPESGWRGTKELIVR